MKYILTTIRSSFSESISLDSIYASTPPISFIHPVYATRPDGTYFYSIQQTYSIMNTGYIAAC